MVELKKVGMIALLSIAAILLAVIVFEGWTLASYVASNVIMIFIFLIVLALVAFVIWKLLIQVEERPTVSFREKMKDSAVVSCPRQLYGHTLWIEGDQKHSPHPVGKIIGWTSMLHEYRVPYMVKGKPQEDKYGHPIMVPDRYKEDIYRMMLQPDGSVKKVLVHKKGEIKTWNESFFLVAGKMGQKSWIYRIPESLHSDLVGDVMCSCYSFIPKGEFMYPNTIYNQPIREDIQVDEIRKESFYSLLDEIKLGVKKGMDSDPRHRKEQEHKKLLSVPEG